MMCRAYDALRDAWRKGLENRRNRSRTRAAAAAPENPWILDAVTGFFPDADDDAIFSAGLPTALDADPRGVPASLDEAEGGEATAPPETYFSLSRKPLTSLVFALPLVLAYEGGVLALGRGTPRNGADVWLRQALDGLGFGSYFLLPTLTVIGLLAWHHVAHDSWRFSPATLAGMCLESVSWAFSLVGLGRLQESLWPLQAAAGHPLTGLVAQVVGFCGAGLYEEVLFRLLMLPAAGWIARKAGAGPGAAATWSVVLTSLAFSAAHYVGPLGDAFDVYSFTFRFLAGMFFAVLFLLRGFGITAGTHAAYDVIVGLL